MEYIEVKIPVHVANRLADCIDVGNEGAEMTEAQHEAVGIVAGEIRIAANLKIEAIKSAYKQISQDEKTQFDEYITNLATQGS